MFGNSKEGLDKTLPVSSPPLEEDLEFELFIFSVLIFETLYWLSLRP